MKACGPASRNKAPILDVLRKCCDSLRERADTPLNILEVASGTGEHAAHFASNIPNCRYQPTEPDSDMIESITSWNESLPHVFRPLNINVESLCSDILPTDMANNNVDIVICINMIHISPFSCTKALFRNAGAVLRPGGMVLLYGPYRVRGSMVESNVAFDKSLQSRNSEWGVRDLELVHETASELGGFSLDSVTEMPANNLCVVFKK